MKDYWKFLIAFAAGAVGGGLSVWIFMKRKYDKMVNEKISALDEYYKTYYGDGGWSDDVSDVESFTEVEEDVQESPGKMEMKVDTHKVDYTSYFKSEKELSEAEHPMESGYGEVEETEEEAKETKSPKFIKAIDYGSGGFGTMDLLYYQDNDTLVIDDEVNQEVLTDFDEIESMIGDALTKYGFKEDDEPVIYIRNYSRNRDYMITKVFDKFSDHG